MEVSKSLEEIFNRDNKPKKEDDSQINVDEEVSLDINNLHHDDMPHQAADGTSQDDASNDPGSARRKVPDSGGDLRWAH